MYLSHDWFDNSIQLGHYAIIRVTRNKYNFSIFHHISLLSDSLVHRGFASSDVFELWTCLISVDSKQPLLVKRMVFRYRDEAKRNRVEAEMQRVVS